MEAGGRGGEQGVDKPETLGVYLANMGGDLDGSSVWLTGR
jgi:hypothetical protein